MKRLIQALMLSFALIAAPMGASASSVEEAIISQLQAQGFREIVVSRTFLGRSRIKAIRGTLEREIVVNPRTGVILRDYSKTGAGEGRIPSLINPADGSPTSPASQAPTIADPDDTEDAEEDADEAEDADEGTDEGDDRDEGDDGDDGGEDGDGDGDGDGDD